MNIYYLYIKTHRKTGFKYLGQTTQNPFKYKGSGVDWLKHLNTYGNKDIDTVILHESCNKIEVNDLGRYYSNLWNIVQSSEWANKIPETGGGGGRLCMSAEERKRMSDRMVGTKRSPETIKKQTGNNHWTKLPEHATHVHAMNRPEVRARISGRNSYMYNHNKYIFHNTITNNTVTMTMYDFQRTFNLDQSSISRVVSGKYKQHKNWILGGINGR
jgi:hypothetical protein